MKLPVSRQQVLAAVAIVAAVAILVIIVREPYLAEKNRLKALFGTIGILPFVATVGTLVFVAYNAILSQRQAKISAITLKNNTEALDRAKVAETVGRFQRASEMLGSGNIATRIAGVLLLRDIAELEPEKYYVPVLSMLIVFAEQHTKDNWEAAQELKDYPKNQQADRPALWNKAFTQTPDDVLAAVRSIGVVRQIKNSQVHEEAWIGAKERLWLRRVILVDRTIRGGNFGRMEIQDGFLDRVNFVDCVFTGTSITDATMIETTFTKGNMESVHITTSDKIQTPNRNDAEDRRLTFIDVPMDESTIETTKLDHVIARNPRGDPDFPPTDHSISRVKHLAEQTVPERLRERAAQRDLEDEAATVANAQN